MSETTTVDPEKGEPANQDPTDEGKGSETDLTAEVDKWKALSRKNEEQAKANAEAAKRLAELENANKTEAERQADVLKSTEAERDEARAELARLHAALKHGLDMDDLDLLGTGDPDVIEGRAKRLADRLAATGKSRKPGPDPTQGNQADPTTSTAAQFAAAIEAL